ncbi:hypothetical protein ISN45_Aa05g024700 [Arabidopsis thaliana x Arabidopsis arenosa]|uniref:Uncharacterized protein n=1 Tax=Arabidopsis thaliana x Arabidopsis arenosa TaxID=1240361 RepID=A0A8T1ZNK1_9BRAS|nr:hypothetical protein ISN45_Aa05g024700 [Arabidopsis thaliana x Arabidopsis arenosa]
MRTLCPNFDREDGLETVLEVPMPEELFCSDNNKSGTWRSVKSSLLRSPPDNSSSLATLFGGRDAQIQMLLGIVGAPSIPLPVSSDQDEIDHPISNLIKNQSIESAMAKYIVKQYTAAAGGEMDLAAVESMYAIGKVKMGVTEFCAAKTLNGKRKKKMVRIRNFNNNNGNGGEIGGFVLWKKGLSQWSLELVVSGCKVSAGCDGNVAWKQSPWLAHSHASNEPSGPLRRFLQGLDPKTTANLFAGSVCVGEKAVNDEECFVLKLETQPSGLKSRSKSGMETVKHTVWGCFSQRTGLLVQLEDTYLVRIKTGPEEEDMVLWETTSETLIQDYKSVDGIQIAHRGKTRVSLLRLDESLESHSKTTMEESWEIEEVGFNVKGLSSDFFLPPGDLHTKEEEESGFSFGDYSSPMLLPLKVSTASWKLKSSKVTAIEDFGEFEG